jgi:ribonucleoside-triphosphate reductase
MDLSADSFGNGGVNIGSHRVITPNLPRAALIANGDLDAFYRILDDYFDMAAKLLVVHRHAILEGRIDKNPNYLPFFGKLKWFSMDTMFSTFGITGVYEMCKFMGYDLLSEEGQGFVADTLNYLKRKARQYKQEYGVPFNLEEIPGEQACVTLVEKDKIFLGECGPDLSDIHFYSNQYIPLIIDTDLVSRLEISGQFMRTISGGGIVHLNVSEQVRSQKMMYDLYHIAAKSGVNHMAVCYRFGMCENGHTNIVGQKDQCPVCGGKIVRARNRVIGYYSEESNWHPARQEHDARYRAFENVEEEEE